MKYCRFLLNNQTHYGTVAERNGEFWITGPAPAPVIVDIPHRGCAFQPRCPVAEEKCKVSAPDLEQFPGQREVRCFCLR